MGFIVFRNCRCRLACNALIPYIGIMVFNCDPGENCMTEKDKLLVMTACKLLGKDVKFTDVEKAFDEVKKRLELSRLPPREAKVSHAIRRD
jgi:hypothetical protein